MITAGTEVILSFSGVRLAKALLAYETLSGDEIKDLIFKNIQPKASTGNEDKDKDKEESSVLGSLGLKPKPAI